VNLFNDYEYDQFQNLDLRFVLGGGLGYNVIKNDRTKLDLLGGISYNREAFATPLTRNSAEFYWGDDYSQKIGANTSLTHSFRMFNNLSSLGEYRINFDLGIATSINKWLALQATASDRYLSNPVAGRVKNDILFTAGVRVNFSR
jgi:putative salt-induced outer membrane protein YdiY